MNGYVKDSYNLNVHKWDHYDGKSREVFSKYTFATQHNSHTRQFNDFERYNYQESYKSNTVRYYYKSNNSH